MQSKIQQLRDTFNGIDKVDPCGEAYKALCTWLDQQSKPTLQALADAKVKWVSSLARNRLARSR